MSDPHKDQKGRVMPQTAMFIDNNRCLLWDPDEQRIHIQICDKLKEKFLRCKLKHTQCQCILAQVLKVSKTVLERWTPFFQRISPQSVFWWWWWRWWWRALYKALVQNQPLGPVELRSVGCEGQIIWDRTTAELHFNSPQKVADAAQSPHFSFCLFHSPPFSLSVDKVKVLRVKSPLRIRLLPDSQQATGSLLTRDNSLARNLQLISCSMLGAWAPSTSWSPSWGDT